ncbi:ABC transporter substrate-binding protein [uncultured Parolsenella sp.]|uniref:ABC transporter substrate-binding protein n=1 Tax=uncultured Parolsenella sp. TaxID=2083008 RepID=UPI0025EB2FC0|nr:ABC transporter substrate-binding protein [uncultured Parolsenella sp.]
MKDLKLSRRSFVGGATILGATVVSASLTGCGGSDSAAASSDGGVVTGGTLSISLSASPSNLDPCKYSGVYESQVINNVCDTLVQYKMDLSEIVPCLATDWTISDDGLTYTFNLRDDVKFQKGQYQDGRALTADDVKYALERSATESALKRLSMLDHCNVVSDTQIECVLKQPAASFLTALTDAGNVIVPKEEVEGWGDAFGDHLVGSGPFCLQNYAKDQVSELVRNDNYWGDKPALDGVKFKVIKETSQATNALQTGDCDVTTDVSGESIQIIKDDENLTLDQKDALHISYCYMNQVNGPCADQKVRKAILMAVDRQQIVDGIYQYGEGSVATLPLPKGSWGYDEAVEADVPAYDVEGAKKLLAEAGYPDGLSLTYYYSSNATGDKVFTILQQQLKNNLNIELEAHTGDWGTFSADAASGIADIYSMSWSWYPDPYFFLNKLFSRVELGALGNGAGFDHDDVEDLLDKGLEATDQEERAKYYKQALKAIVAYDPMLVYTSRKVSTGLSNKVQGYTSRADQLVYVVNSEVNVSKTA